MTEDQQLRWICQSICDGRLVPGMDITKQAVVRVAEETLNKFEVHRGVRQNCILSPYLSILMRKM